MLNCFYGYSIIWTLVLILYAFDFSDFNNQLDINLLIFIIFTIIFSFILGFINRNKFKFRQEAKDYGLIHVLLISIGYIVNFIYARNIPFLKIAILRNSGYGDFEGIPVLYVLIVGISFYYGMNYINAYFNLEKNKKKNLISFIIIIMFYLLSFSRSMMLFSIGGAFILYIQKRKQNKIKEEKKKKASLLLISTFTIIAVFLFGALGNIRSGYSFNDNSYIERLGMYNDNYPVFIPKQFMWAYSYLTTPLANLNYNVSAYKNNINFNYRGVTSELINRTFSKRIFPDLYHNVKNEDFGFELIKTYFSASTGYCVMFIYGGYSGIIIQYFVLNMITYIQLSLLKREENKGKANSTFIIMLLVNTLMFFYNSLNTTMMAWWILVNFVALLPKYKLKWRSK